MGKIFLEILLLFFTILILHTPFSFSADEKPPQEVITAAREGISTFLQDARAQRLHLLGFQSQEEVDQVTLGEGFQVFTVLPDSLLGPEMIEGLDRLAVPTHLWQFLLMSGGRAKAVLTVDLMNGKWTAVSVGASVLAGHLRRILETWPSSSGYSYRLIRIYQAKSDFIELSKGEEMMGFIPLLSARVAMGLPEKDFNALDLRHSRDILPSMRPIVEENIRNR